MGNLGRPINHSLALPINRPLFGSKIGLDLPSDPIPSDPILALQQALAAEYAGQEESGPMLRTWGSEYLASIPAVNNPDYDPDGPGELTARYCQRNTNNDISTYFAASDTDLFDLSTGPVDFWMRHSRPNTTRHIGSADPTLSVGQDSQWQMGSNRGDDTNRLYIDAGDGIARHDAPLVGDTDWHRYYLEYTDGELVMRWGGHDWTVEAEDLIGDASRVLIGPGPGSSNTANSYFALIRKWSRPLTPTEHDWLDANPVPAAEMPE